VKFTTPPPVAVYGPLPDPVAGPLTYAIVTGSPDVAVALTLNGLPPYVGIGNVPTLIVCDAGAIVTLKFTGVAAA
jgi:hypothetical protein